MKIVLISPKGPLYRHRGGIFGRTLRYKPLTLTQLAALVPPELDADVELIDEGIQDVSPRVEADLIGMTVITGNAPRTYELSARFRAQGTPVVLGGPHVTLVPDDARPHADVIVTGYAEQTFPELLRDFAAGRMRDRYEQSPSMTLENLPFPRRDMLPRRRYITDAVFEAQRGCLHDCDFCVVPSAWSRKLYQKPVEDVVADIRRHGGRRIVFVDLNMIADRAYAARLFEALIPLGVQWHGLTTVLLADDDELLDLAARSGCRGLLMGLESINTDGVRNCGKRFNSPDRYAEMIDKLHRRRIALNGCFVFGLDQDGPDVFLRTAKFAVEAGIDLPRYAVLTPFPGTPLHLRLDAEDRILTRNWELYDGQHVVFRPERMSPQELQRGVEEAWRYTYSMSSIARRIRVSPVFRPLALAANLTYRRYARNLHRFYTCDWSIENRAAALLPTVRKAPVPAEPNRGDVGVS